MLLLYPLLLILSIAQQPTANPEPDWVLEHVSLFDGNGEVWQIDMSIAVLGDTILSVVPSAAAPPWNTAEHVDGTHRFGIPGLWDMHIHPDDPELWEMNPSEKERENLMPLFLLNGVTSVRDMGGDLERLQGWKRKIESGNLLGPRIFMAGPLVDGPRSMWPGSVAVGDAEAGRKAVDDLIAKKVDFIKVYSLLGRTAFQAIAEQSNLRGIRFSGHVPYRMGIVETAELGMHSQEHLLNWIGETAHPKRLLDWQIENGLSADANRREAYNWKTESELAAADDEAVKKLAVRLAELGTAQVPTMIMWKRQAWFDRKENRVAPFLQFLPQYLQDWWNPKKNIHLRDLTAADIVLKQKVFQRNQEILRILHQQGVIILPGTDTGGNPLLPMGFSLHDELAELVACGLSPADVLQAATRQSAELMGVGNKLGQIKAGYLADFLVLEKDPLSDIHNTSSLYSVISRGNRLSKQAIAQHFSNLSEASQ